MLRKLELMPQKFDWRTKLFAQSCVDLTNSPQTGGHSGYSPQNGGINGYSQLNGGSNGSQVILAVAFRGRGDGGEVEARREMERCRRSLPPDLGVLEDTVPPTRGKSDVVHWKTKVWLKEGGGGDTMWCVCACGGRLRSCMRRTRDLTGVVVELLPVVAGK